MTKADGGGDGNAGLTIYYDASCPLCSAEMHALAARDAGRRLALVDCSAPGFAGGTDAPPRSELMRRIHARDAHGRWLRGIAVFAEAYRAAGFTRTARVLEAPLLRPLLDLCYGPLADHRRLLTAVGLHRALAWVLGRPRRE